MSRLVQISDLKFPQHSEVAYNYGYVEGGSHTALEVANMTRHRLILKLVAELSEMFGRIGMHGVCGRCFKGRLNAEERRLNYGSEGHGCCGSCSVLGHASCLNKPLGCAIFMCAITDKLWPQTKMFLRGVYEKLREAKIISDVYSTGIVREHLLKLNLEQRRALRTAIREVRAWNEDRVRTEAA